jgi:hypothetical protein
MHSMLQISSSLMAVFVMMMKLRQQHTNHIRCVKQNIAHIYFKTETLHHVFYNHLSICL